MTKGKKIISILLVLCIAVSAIGFSVFAADNRNTTAQPREAVNIEIPNAQVIKSVIDKYFGGPDLFAKFIAGTVGQIVTGTYSDHLAEVIVNAYHNGIIIGDISKMTDEEVKAMLDQIYWVYADNPGPITQTVDCIKMFVNWSDAAIHWGQDGILGEMQKKLETYYRNWLLEHCDLGLLPEIPTKPTDPVDPTDPTDPTKPTDPTDPTNPTNPTDPTDPTKPTDPTEPTDPTKPTDPTEPTDPTKPTDPTDPTEPSDSTEPSEEEPSTEAPSEPDDGSNVPTGDSLAIALVAAAAVAAGGAIIISKKSRKAE